MLKKLIKGKLSISNILLINAIGFTVFSLVFIGYLWMSQEREKFKKEAEKLKADYITSQKLFLKREVEHAKRYINYNRDQIYDQLRNSIKNRVYEAHAIANSIWKANKESKTDKVIKNMIRDALKDIRFNEGRGYYFISQLDGLMVLFADRPGEEGKNYWNRMDTSGQYFGRIMAGIVSQEKEGFVKYKMSKPNTTESSHSKLAFVKHFEPYDWFIGTGEYLDDFEMSFKAEVLKLIQKVEYGRGGYIFAGKWDGTSLSGPALGKNMIDVTDINGLKIVQELIKVAKAGGGYVTYVMPKLGGQKKAPKISYAEAIEDWQWYIGAGIYVDEIDAVIATKQLILEKQINRDITNIIVIIITCLVMIFLIARFLSNRIHRNIQTLTGFFETSATTFESIDTRRLHFPEFLRLAVSANKMVQERNRAGEALKESEKEYRELAQSSNSIILKVDPDFKLTFINKFAQDFFGFSEVELIGKSIFGNITPEIESSGRDLKKILADIVNNPNANADYENENIRKSGNRVWVAWRNKCIFDDEGNYSQMLCTGYDITKRKETEAALKKAHGGLEKTVMERTEKLHQSLETLKKTQDQLVQTEKMASLGALVAGVAHEINTPLGISVTEASYQKDIIEDCYNRFKSADLTESAFNSFLEDSKQSSLSILKNLKRAVNLINSFKQTAVDQIIEEKRAFDVKIYIDEILISIHSKVKSTGHSIENCCPGNVIIVSYPGAFAQIITNFVINSLHHGFDGIKSGKMVFNAKMIDQGQESQMLELTYSDNGVGMDETILNSIFEPFFTTKRNKGGTGLGMHIVYNLVTQKLRGQIQCQSLPGQGTMFIIQIPLTVD